MRPNLVFLHSSDELYGADRMLLELLAAVPDHLVAEVWLPTDLPHVDAPLCEELTRRGYAVRHLDLPIMRRAYRTAGGLARLARKEASLVRELRAVRPGTVYCTTSAAFLAAPAARLAGVDRVIGHVQEIWSAGDRAVLSAAGAACHRLIAISGPAAASLPARLAARTTVVPNATPDPGPLVPVEPTGELNFVIASRWNGWKGHRTLLAAWDALDEPGHLVVLGGPPASGEVVDVPTIVAGLRRPETVTVVGEVLDIAPYLRRADVAIVPSDEPEPFGLVAIEAFARGRAVIGSDGGGLADIVTDGSDGWLFPRGDVAALTAVLTGLDKARTAAAGRAARAAFEARFTTAAYRQNWLAAVGLITSPAGDPNRSHTVPAR